MDHGRGYQRGATGARDEEEDVEKTFKTKTPQKVKPGGKLEVIGMVNGKQTKGESQLDIEASVEANTAAATDALNRQNIPRDYKKHAKEYFEQVGNTKP